MTGTLLLRRPSDPVEPYVRLTLHLDDGRELRFKDPRKFGKIFVMEGSGAERPLPWSSMGPEPLHDGFSVPALREAFGGRRAKVKPLLLDQRIVAGLGNIYVDEALYLARIHPERRVNTLTRSDVQRLHAAIRDVLAAAVEGRGTTFSSYADVEGRAGQYQSELRVFRRAGAACGRCGTPIVRIVVGGRGTHLCPRCQRV
jgi:formamidopyrimidine-DNA glycosylase